MIQFSKFKQNLLEVRARIESACATSGRPEDAVALLPVTKNHRVEAVQYATQCGLRSVGENRVQEAKNKQVSYEGPAQWELIGHLQSNKVRLAVSIFDRIQSVDSIKLIRRIDLCAGDQGKRMPVLLQCNSGEDPRKKGFVVDEAERVLEAALEAENLRVDGLMTIAPPDDPPGVAKAAFERLRMLRDRLSESFDCPLTELSMGMTNDLEAAIAAGSTQIRVGTALYGMRR